MTKEPHPAWIADAEAIRERAWNNALVKDTEW